MIIAGIADECAVTVDDGYEYNAKEGFVSVARGKNEWNNIWMMCMSSKNGSELNQIKTVS